MTKQKVLVIEDENDIRELITLHLTRESYAVEECTTGSEGLEKALAGDYELLVVDWMLPGLSGMEIIKEVRKKKNHDELSILMVTAKSANSDIIMGLECGADDYLVKPFELSVLMARVRALLRRKEKKSASSSSEIKIGNLTLNPDAHEASCGNQKILFTPYEFKLLLSLVKNRGRVLTRDQLIQEVQGDGVAVVERAIDTHVFGLRKKMGECAEIIETVRGVGYRVTAKA